MKSYRKQFTLTIKECCKRFKTRLQYFNENTLRSKFKEISNCDRQVTYKDEKISLGNLCKMILDSLQDVQKYTKPSTYEECFKEFVSDSKSEMNEATTYKKNIDLVYRIYDEGISKIREIVFMINIVNKELRLMDKVQ